MTTVLTIILAVLVAFNVWLGIYTVKMERERRRRYLERMNECDERIGEVMNELGKAKQHLNEANSAKAALKRSFEETVKEYEKLTRDYRKLQDDLGALKQGKGVLLVNEADLPDGKTAEDIAKEWSNFNGKVEYEESKKPIKPKKKPARKAKK